MSPPPYTFEYIKPILERAIAARNGANGSGGQISRPGN